MRVIINNFHSFIDNSNYYTLTTGSTRVILTFHSFIKHKTTRIIPGAPTKDRDDGPTATAVTTSLVTS